jgi:predicted XRE-type DNA-binding protein
MAKRIVGVTKLDAHSSDAVADRGIAQLDKLTIKSGLLIEITNAVRTLGLTQDEAAKRMGIPQPKVSGLLRGDVSNLSERKLMGCLNRLGYDIEITVKPTREAMGCLTLSIGGRQAP